MRNPRRFLLSISLLACCTIPLPGHPTADASAAFLPGFPQLRQQHNLTCESSAASMATRGKLSETQLMALMARNPNPNLGFRGNPDGQQGTRLVDYGVYAGPIHQSLQRSGFNSDIITYGTRAGLQNYIDRGWPVVVWITYALQRAQPRLAEWGGMPFLLVPHEHTVLLVGYDDRSVLANDPWNGTRVRYSWRGFRRAWGYFADMALAVQPCRLPDPVAGLTVSALTTTAITWSWQPSARATQYQVDVVRRGKAERVVYSNRQPATSLTLPSPLAGRIYEIHVRAIAACGATTDPDRFSVLIPAVLPSPTPSPSEVSITATPATPSATGTATPGDIPTVAPTLSPTTHP